MDPNYNAYPQTSGAVQPAGYQIAGPAAGVRDGAFRWFCKADPEVSNHNDSISSWAEFITLTAGDLNKTSGANKLGPRGDSTLC